MKNKLLREIASVKVIFLVAATVLLFHGYLDQSNWVMLVLGLLGLREASDLRNSYFNDH